MKKKKKKKGGRNPYTWKLKNWKIENLQIQCLIVDLQNIMGNSYWSGRDCTCQSLCFNISIKKHPLGLKLTLGSLTKLCNID